MTSQPRSVSACVYTTPLWGQEVKQDFLAILLSTMWPSCQKTGSSLLGSRVRGQTSWLHHLGQILHTHTHTHTHKTFSSLYGDVQSHILSKCLVKAAALPHATTARPEKQWGWEGARLHGNASHSSAKHTKTFRPRFLPHSCCQSKRASDGELTERGKRVKYLRWFMFDVLGVIGGKVPRVHRFYGFILKFRHLLFIL